jgi:hypothetical protein
VRPRIAIDWAASPSPQALGVAAEIIRWRGVDRRRRPPARAQLSRLFSAFFPASQEMVRIATAMTAGSLNPFRVRAIDRRSVLRLALTISRLFVLIALFGDLRSPASVPGNNGCIALYFKMTLAYRLVGLIRLAGVYARLGTTPARFLCSLTGINRSSHSYLISVRLNRSTSGSATGGIRKVRA